MATFLRTFASGPLFPVKMKIPILLTVYALMCFHRFRRLAPGTGGAAAEAAAGQSTDGAEALPPGWFAVPADFERISLQEKIQRDELKARRGRCMVISSLISFTALRVW